VSELLERAAVWIEPYWNADHLRSALDWLLVIAPDATEAMRLAALTHDIERHFPGGPVYEPGTMAPHDDAYATAHAERSARIVGEWLQAEGAPDSLVRDVAALIELHEVGGTPEADLLQAADSLSFLETNARVVRRWVDQGRCGPERAKEQLSWMLERISVERARELAQPLYPEALAVVDG
jgi:hypothetical protein